MLKPHQTFNMFFQYLLMFLLYMYTGLSHVHAEWTNTGDLVQQNCQFHIRFQVLAAFVFPIGKPFWSVLLHMQWHAQF